MTELYRWNPMPNCVTVKCDHCASAATFEFAVMIRIGLKADVDYFRRSSYFDYQFMENWAVFLPRTV